MKAGKTQTKANSTFVMTIRGHDPSLTTQTLFHVLLQNFIYVNATHWKSFCHHPITFPPALYFVILSSLNSLIAKACPAFMALERPVCENGFSKKKKCFMRVFHWLIRTEQCLLHHLLVPKGTTASQSPDLTSSQLLPSRTWEMKGKVMGDTRKPPFIFCGDFLDLPSSLCIMEASLV